MYRRLPSEWWKNQTYFSVNVFQEGPMLEFNKKMLCKIDIVQCSSMYIHAYVYMYTSMWYQTFQSSRAFLESYFNCN